MYIEAVQFRRFQVYSMLLLTNCEVHMGKYSDRNFEVRTERTKWGPYEKVRFEYFPVWTELIGQ